MQATLSLIFILHVFSMAVFCGQCSMPYLADLDGRRSTWKAWKTCLERSHFAEWTTPTGVDCSHAKLVRSARLQFQTLQSVVIWQVHHINVLQPSIVNHTTTFSLHLTSQFFVVPQTHP